MIWIIGGTSEFNDIITKIKDLGGYVGTIATEGGKDFFDLSNIIIGRMDYIEMINFIEKNQITTIVDLSHPYAKIVSENAKKACQEKSIEYIRYVREKTKFNNNEIYLNNYEEAYEYIKTIKGNIFFTTGSKNIKDFQKIRGENRFIYRILPAMESIEECRRYDVNMKDIVAVVGPFSKEYNKIMFKEYDIDYIVTKDSGSPGGTLEKVQAASELGINIIIIGRKEEEGINNIIELEQIIRERLLVDNN